MKQTLSDEVFDTLPKKPNFLLILALTGAAIVIFFLATFVVLHYEGKKMMPGTDRNPHPNSYLYQPGSKASEA